MNRYSLFILIILFLIPDLSKAQNYQNTIVGSVDNEAVTFQELLNNFNQSSQDDISLEDLKDFLPVYLDYKAKLKQARELGYYENEEIQQEYILYSKQAAYSYWIKNKIKPEIFDDYKKRSEQELKAFHVLIDVSPTPSQVLVDEAKSKLKEAAEEIKEGIDLEEINRKYSSLRDGRHMGGTLPWLSVGTTVRTFEDVIYKLEVGEISEPFQTRFGYHIAYLLDRRPKTPERQASHIFIRQRQDSSDAAEIMNAYESLEMGRPWNEVVKEFSEDNLSKASGGSIGWVDYGTAYSIPFIEKIMNMDPNLNYSEPFESVYGYHILRIDSIRTYNSEEERNAVLMKELEESNYLQENNAFVVNYLQEKMGHTSYLDNIESLNDVLTSGKDITMASFVLPSTLKKEIVYSFNNTTYTIDDFLNYLKETRPDKTIRQFRLNWFDDFKTYVVDNQILELTVNQFPEFSSQLQNYLDGLVVYKVNDDFLWSAATVDTSKLRSIYKQNISEYSYDERPFYYLYSAKSDSVLGKIKSFIAEGNSPDSVRTYISGVAVQKDSTNTFQGNPFDRLNEMKVNTFSDYFDYRNRRAFFLLKDRLPARNMTFKEAFNRVLSDYQPEREKLWIDTLRDKFTMEYNYNQLEKAFEAYSK